MDDRNVVAAPIETLAGDKEKIRREEWNQIYIRLDRVILACANSLSSPIISVTVGKKYATIRDVCCWLQGKLLRLENPTDADLAKFKRKSIEMDSHASRLAWTYEAFPLLYIAAFVFLHALFFGDFASVGVLIGSPWAEKLWDSPWAKYVLVGVLGVALYFSAQREDDLASIQVMMRRIVTAIMVSVLLVVLFVDSKGKLIAPDAIDGAALLSLACGYSALLVPMLLNKVIEKARKIIEAL